MNKWQAGLSGLPFFRSVRFQLWLLVRCLITWVTGSLGHWVA
ncbi:MAG: hypothetical protein ACRC7Q_13605 [Plesiomonas shigelloides]